MHLPCGSLSNASKLDAVLVDRFFTVFGGEKRRGKKRGKRGEKRREKRREKKEGTRGKNERKKGEQERQRARKTEERGERGEKPSPRAQVQHASVCTGKTPACLCRSTHRETHITHTRNTNTTRHDTTRQTMHTHHPHHTRLLGFVHGGQPTVIFRSFCANAWLCARRATDRDLESVSATKKVNAWLNAPRITDGDPASVIVDKIWNICNFRNFMRTYCSSN